MDCRNCLVVALSLAVGAAGCSGLRSQPQPTATTQVAVEVTKEKDLPPRTPKAATCVAFGNFSERECSDPKMSAADREKKLDQARKAYQQALDIDSHSVPAAQGLARVYAQLGDQERAVSTYRQAIQKNPKEAALWYDLAMCHARKKEWVPAVENLRTAVKLAPDNRDYAKSLGFTLARAGRYDESVASLSKVMSKAKAHYNVARMLHHLKQDDLSRQHMQLALKADPVLASGRDVQELLAALQRPGAAGQTIVPASYQAPAGGKR